MFFACRVRLVFRDKSERTATKDHGGVAAIALCPDTLRGSCSGRESAIKLFQTAVSCRPSRHSPCCERLLTLPLLSMSWSILLKVWPLFRCSCMAAFGCSLRYIGFLSERHPPPYNPQHAEIGSGTLIKQFQKESHGR